MLLRHDEWPHPVYLFGSVDWVKGRHVVKFGGEMRQFFNNFYQPDYATGVFEFTKLITASNPAGGNDPRRALGWRRFRGVSPGMANSI